MQANFKSIYAFTLLFSLMTITLQGQQIATVRGDNINVRTCADLNCEVVVQLNRGDKCEILSNVKEATLNGYDRNAWFHINYQGQEGLVYGAFLEFTTKTLAITAKNTNTSLSSVTADKVNARTCASLLCNKAFQLEQGRKVKIVAKTEEALIANIGKKPWYEIDYQGQRGFVFGQFIDGTNCDFSTTNTTTTPTKKTGTITGDNVNIRTCQNTNCEVAFQLNIGSTCEIKEVLYPNKNRNQQPWYKINYQGKIGYVFGQYLSTTTRENRATKVWAVVAGIADYPSNLNVGGVTDLQFSATDAKRMYQFLKSPQGGNLPDNQIRLLRNKEATKAAILTTAKELFFQAGPNDLVIVYFSGHGGPNFFVAYDQALNYSDIKTIVERSPAKKRLCIADACHSGTWSDNATALATNQSMSNEALERLYYEALSNSGNSIALFMSSAPEEYSLESPQLGQGLFTYLYIEGLKGRADLDGNRIITLQELAEFVKVSVRKTAREQFNHSQTPSLSGFYDPNMPVGIVRK